ncbi:ribosomal protein L7Ae [Trichinella nativa]|uniref:Ribosomal protein L7Ae n=1 Tax=Trichinella nativa TaxID=6335 RepID=A0A1Y3ER17_9BILA|nr:ribosomal protein L7Ae [Trichinella nativa]
MYKVKGECRKESKLPKKPSAEEVVRHGNFLDSTAPIKIGNKNGKVNQKKKPNRTVMKKLQVPVYFRNRFSQAIIEQRQTNANIGQGNEAGSVGAVERNAKILQLIDNEADEKLFGTIEMLIVELKRLQDRVYQINPALGLQKRRVVLGLREVEAHIRRNKIQMVIFAMDLEDGAYQYVSNVISQCRKADIPYVFGLNRRRLAKICMKQATVSVVGVLEHQGATQHFNELKEMIAVHRKSQMNNAVIDSVALMSVADEHGK